ncbi:YaeQ family protein [Anaeromyxobacter sp. Fw109-5]|uniref:YaeQ family protein n=1 Tax=Anaeromyxobacter sp. (strain Fw109-5) TaxID=404589 RepID=UPI0000ED7F5E|nr:YaeQ family protein [Anaeromyxobacter sp. Fw109-5]ABS25110.1 conserved hypothetical protein [Anaeromyxobacter sp. Fw109-5]
MALPSTLHHFDLRIVHADSGLEASVALKTARHPSETVERLWLRVLAYGWQWQEGIAFGPGLCEPDAPDVVAARPDGRAALVLRVGKPEPQRVERDVNANAGARVAVLFESPRRLEAFVAEARERRLARLGRTELAAVDPSLLAWLSRHEDRRTRLELTFVADHLYVDLAGEAGDGPLLRATV